MGSLETATESGVRYHCLPEIGKRMFGLQNMIRHSTNSKAYYINAIHLIGRPTLQRRDNT